MQFLKKIYIKNMNQIQFEEWFLRTINLKYFKIYRLVNIQ